jgi:nucleotide-binding universal stress UspA family protein
VATLLALVKEPDDSKEFVAYALHLAESLNINIHFLYVQDPATHPFGTPGLTGEASVQIQINLEKTAADAKNIIARHVEAYASGDVFAEISTETAIIRPVIEKLLAQDKVHMVLMEGSESDGFWTQNSTDMDIIRNIKCPAWVIPPKITYDPFKEILYATDYHEEDLLTLRKLIALTHRFSPNITALHITENYDFEVRIKKAGFQEMVKTKTAYDKVSVESLVDRTGEDIGQMINDYASLIDANLIVVLKENRPFFDRLFKSSSAKKIIQQAKIPVLVYHEQGA